MLDNVQFWDERVKLEDILEQFPLLRVVKIEIARSEMFSNQSAKERERHHRGSRIQQFMIESAENLEHLHVRMKFDGEISV